MQFMMLNAIYYRSWIALHNDNDNDKDNNNDNDKINVLTKLSLSLYYAIQDLQGNVPKCHKEVIRSMVKIG